MEFQLLASYAHKMLQQLLFVYFSSLKTIRKEIFVLNSNFFKINRTGTNLPPQIITRSHAHLFPHIILPSLFSGPVQTREEARHTSTSPHPGHILSGPHTALTQPSPGSGDRHPSSTCHQHSQVLLPPWAPCHGLGGQPRRSHRCHRGGLC